MTITRLDNHFDQAGAWELLAAQSGGLAFDIGANIGQSTRVLAANFETVVALEPCAESYTILAAECADNVVCVPAAATNRSGTVRLTETAVAGQFGQLTTGTGLGWGDKVGERDVPAVTVDDLVAEHGHPDFVKIDTEGHEIAVLEGWTTRSAEMIVEVHAAGNEERVREMVGRPMRKLVHSTAIRQWTRENHFWLTTLDAR